MSSLSPKDRVSLCSFTFSDGRRCRTPRIGKHPRFCFYHAQKEARARAAKKLSKDLAYFFSGDYLSACDLSTALARLIPAVVRGDVKPKTARTVAYLAQTLLQTIHISEQEYINAFGTDGWRKSVRNSVNYNHDYLFPPAPEPDSAPEPEQSESLQPQPQPAPPQAQAPQPAAALPSNPPQPAPAAPVAHPADPSLTSAHAPESPASHTSPSHLPGHPVRTDADRLDPAVPTTGEPHPIPPTQFAPSVAPGGHPDNPLRTGPSTPQPAPNRGADALHFDHNCRLLIDGKPF